MKKVFIIILNYNGGKFVLNCLKSVSEIIKKNYLISVIIIDNASTDNSVFLIRQMFPRIKIIKNKENMGFAEGNNIGIRYALNNGADYVMLLNNDTVVDRNLLMELIKTAEKNDQTGIVAPKIYFAPGYEYHHHRYKDKERGKVIWYAGGVMDWNNVLASHRGVDQVDVNQYDNLLETDFASGCCLLIKKAVFKKIGLINRRYFLYYEDTDFCQRAKLAGFKTIFAPKAFLWHLNASSAGGSGSILQDYYLTRNRLLFTLKYAPLKSKLSVYKEAFCQLFSKNQIKKRAILDFFFGQFGRKINL